MVLVPGTFVPPESTRVTLPKKKKKKKKKARCRKTKESGTNDVDYQKYDILFVIFISLLQNEQANLPSRQ